VSRERHFAIWLVVLAVFCVLVYLLRSMLLPFVAGMGVAYFLDPVADRLEKWGLSRTLATSLITAAFFVGVIVVLILLVPLLEGQVVAFIGRLPGYAEALREYAGPLLERLEASLSAGDMESLGDAAGAYAGQAIKWIGALLVNVWSGGVALFQLISLVVITPLVSFYLLRDWDRIVEQIDAYLPRKSAHVIHEQIGKIDRTVAGFVRGQATVCLILAVYYAVGLSLVGLEFGLLIGLGTGLISFIPYFGMMIGLAAGFGVALAQYSDIGSIALVAGVFAVGQVMEGNFLTPNLVGERIGLHPVWIIFALLAGGTLFGFTGILLAVPAAAVIGVLVRFALESYRDSRLYEGLGDDAGDGR
jgi:predicted PurR-regulated permease PerM